MVGVNLFQLLPRESFDEQVELIYNPQIIQERRKLAVDGERVGAPAFAFDHDARDVLLLRDDATGDGELEVQWGQVALCYVLPDHVQVGEGAGLEFLLFALQVFEGVLDIDDPVIHVHCPFEALVLPRQHKLFVGARVRNAVENLELYVGFQVVLG